MQQYRYDDHPHSRPLSSGERVLLEHLLDLAALYPASGHNESTLEPVLREWSALLRDRDASMTEFLDALTMVKRTCRFFPTVADLNAALREIREHPPVIPERLRLAEPPHPGLSPEKRRRIRQCGEIIAAQLNRRITPAEASRRLNALGLRP